MMTRGRYTIIAFANVMTPIRYISPTLTYVASPVPPEHILMAVERMADGTILDWPYLDGAVGRLRPCLETGIVE